VFSALYSDANMLPDRKHF